MPSESEYWQEQYLDAIQWATTQWGGWFSILIPTNGDSIREEFYKIAQKFDPDHIVRYTPVFGDLQRWNPEEYRARADNEMSRLLAPHDSDTQTGIAEEIRRQLNASSFSLPPISQQVRDRLFEVSGFSDGQIIGVSLSQKSIVSFEAVEVLRVAQARLPIITPLMEGDSTSSLRIAAITGLLEPTNESLNPTTFYSQSGPIDPTYVPGSMRDRTSWQTHPREVSLFGCDFYQHSSRTLDSYRIVVGNTPEDFCIYYDLIRLCGFGVTWLPNVEEYNNNSLMMGAQSASLNSSSGVMATSFSLPEATVREICVRCWPDYARENQLPEFASVAMCTSEIEQPWHLWATCSVSNQQVLSCVEGQSVGTLRTPVPKALADADATKVKWVCEVEISNYLPPRSFVNADSLFNVHNSMGHSLASKSHVRISNLGLCFRCPNILIIGQDVTLNTWNPSLRFESDEDMLRRYFSVFGTKTSASDKGKYSRILIERSGGLGNLAEILQDDICQNILCVLSAGPPPKVHRNDPQMPHWLNGLDRWVATCLQLSGALGRQGFTEVSDQPPEQFDALVSASLDRLFSAQLVNRGFVLKCSSCDACLWYPLEVVGRTFRCERCRTEQVITSGHWRMPSAGPAMFYTLDEVALQFLTHNGELSVLMVQKVINEPGTTHWMLEADFRDEKGNSLESDAVICKNGDIWVCEASRTGSFADSNKVKRLSGLIRDAKCRGVILGTNKDDWDIGQIEQLKKVGNVRVMRRLPKAAS
ncbi:MAG: hypothetical protein U0R49_04825 [Fimbriimonadales bacterium]